MPRNSEIAPLCVIPRDTYGERRVDSPTPPPNHFAAIAEHLQPRKTVGDATSRTEIAATPQAAWLNLSVAVTRRCSTSAGVTAPFLARRLSGTSYFNALLPSLLPFCCSPSLSASIPGAASHVAAAAGSPPSCSSRAEDRVDTSNKAQA